MEKHLQILQVVSPTKQQEKDMTDATPVYQRAARITRATTSTMGFHRYERSSSGSITRGVQTACPLCHSETSVKRDGRNRTRQIRHLSLFGRKSFLHVHRSAWLVHNAISALFGSTILWVPNSDTARLFRTQTVEQALGSTAVHSAHMQQAPVSKVQRMHQEALPKVCERLAKQTWREAEDSSNLVLGVDDFAIKKGHTYNTGIHNLRGETMLDLWAGRKLEDLRAYAQANPHFLALKLKAVVMDLAKAYHTWIAECFPHAIRIADQFHGYVIESVQEIRKSIQHTLSPRAKATLKSHHRLLNPPIDQLCEKTKAQLESLLAFSPLLRSVWE